MTISPVTQLTEIFAPFLRVGPHLQRDFAKRCAEFSFVSKREYAQQVAELKYLRAQLQELEVRLDLLATQTEQQRNPASDK